MNKVQLGAPSLNEKGANESVSEVFAKAQFPLRLKATNLVYHALNFPEVPGFHVEPYGAIEIEVKDFDALQRLASSIEQVAFLYKHAAMVALESVVEALEEAEEEPDEGDDDPDAPEEVEGSVSDIPKKKPGRKPKGA